MDLVRYRIGEGERHAMEALLSRTHGIRADQSLSPAYRRDQTRLPCGNSATEIAFRLSDRAWLTKAEPLSQLTACLAELHDSIITQKAIIVENLPISESAAALVLLMGSLFGEVKEYIGHGAPITEIADKGLTADDRPSSDNALSFELHTDLSFYEQPPAFVGLLMVEQAAQGGESLFCDAMPIIERLSPQEIAALEQPFKFPPPPHRPLSDAQFFPILRRLHDAAFAVRFRRDRLEPRTLEQIEALRKFTSLVDEYVVELLLVPGEMIFFSNRRMLHGRKLFRDHVRGQQRRRALRAYLDHIPTS